MEYFPDVLAQNRFNAARREIEQQPCINPVSMLVWGTAETIAHNGYDRWRDMGNGVYYLRTST